MKPRRTPTLRMPLSIPHRVLLLGLLVLAVAAPALFGAMASLDADWARLSQVGESYGGASAIFSALALGGIVISVRTQQQQNRFLMIEADRQRHADLMRLALEDPELMAVAMPDGHTDPGARQVVFANLLVVLWWRAWENSTLEQAELRENARSIFRNEVVLRWWLAFGGMWTMARSRRTEEFKNILTEVAGEVVAGQAAVPARSRSANPWPRALRRPAGWFVAGAITGAAVGVLIGRRRA